MNCDRTDCIHYKVCEEWKSLGNDNYINDSYGNCEYYAPTVEIPKHSLLPLAGDCDEAYMRGYEIGKAESILKSHTRPKGEWIIRHKLNSFGQDVVCFECNKCGEYKMPLYHLMITKPLKVCPNCGVEMTGDTE